MKKNNKGITLVEIIISISLISLVLIFLFQLLIQLNNENAENRIRASYLVNQSTFIKQIEEDIIGGLLNVQITSPLYFVECSNISLTRLKTLNLYNLYNNEITLSGNDINLKCIGITDGIMPQAYLYLYKKKSGESDYITILGYKNSTFTQTVELEEFDWDMNTNLGGLPLFPSVSTIGKTKAASFPIIGPDGNDYSINISILGMY